MTFGIRWDPAYLRRISELGEATGELCLDVGQSSESGLKGEYRMKMGTNVRNLTAKVFRVAHG